MNQSKGSALIFDFDGTLANTFDLVVYAVNQFSSEYGYKSLTAEDVDYLRGLPAHSILKFLGISWYKLPELIIKFQRFMRAHIGDVALYPGIEETMDTLKSQGFLLGITTSNSRENVNLLLKKHKCEVFSFVSSSHHVFGKAKTIKKVISAWDLDKKTAYYIGDETRDIDAAKRCGIHSVAVTWGFNTKELLVLSKPSLLVEQVEGLLLIR